MKVGDLVRDDFYFNVGLVITEPRLSNDCELGSWGIMNGDVYEVVEVLCDSGEIRLFTTDELRVVNGR